MSVDPSDFLCESCAKISSPEANQAFRAGTSDSPAPKPVRKTGKRKKAYASVKQHQQRTGDENWAMRQPQLTEALEVKKQQSAVGQGLFVRKSFRKGYEAGDAIGEYVGERILEDEYQARIEQYIIDKEFNYIVGVDTEEVAGLYVDATKKGNWTRFVNNSHSPNAQFEPVILSRTWRIYLVASKRIKSGEEITIDYGTEYRTPDQKFVECFCSSDLCSGVIGVPLQKDAITKLLLNDIHYKDDDLNVLCAENRLLDTQNKQLKKQISIIKPMILQNMQKMFDEIFIPITDHRPEDIREHNSKIVQDFLSDNLRIDYQPGQDEMELTPTCSKQVASTSTGRKLRSTRSSLSSKRSAEAEDTDSSHAETQITPPIKKTRRSPRLSVQNIPALIIESSDSTAQQLAVSNSAKIPAKTHVLSPLRRTHRTPTKHVSVVESISDEEDDIVVITPALPFTPKPLKSPKPLSLVCSSATRSGPSSSSSPGSELAVVRSISYSSGEKRPDVATEVLKWYKRVTSLPNTGESFEKHPCPVHRSETFTRRKKVREHFFLEHAGAASIHKKELEKIGLLLGEADLKLYDEGQMKRTQI